MASQVKTIYQGERVYHADSQVYHCSQLRAKFMGILSHIQEPISNDRHGQNDSVFRVPGPVSTEDEFEARRLYTASWLRV